MERASSSPVSRASRCRVHDMATRDPSTTIGTARARWCEPLASTPPRVKATMARPNSKSSDARLVSSPPMLRNKLLRMKPVSSTVMTLASRPVTAIRRRSASHAPSRQPTGSSSSAGSHAGMAPASSTFQRVSTTMPPRLAPAVVPRDGGAGEGVAEQALHQHAASCQGRPREAGVAQPPRTQAQVGVAQGQVGEVAVAHEQAGRHSTEERCQQHDPSQHRAAHWSISGSGASTRSRSARMPTAQPSPSGFSRRSDSRPSVVHSSTWR